MHQGYSDRLLGIGLGALFFGIMAALIAGLGGLRGAKTLPVFSMGLVAGLGLSVAVYVVFVRRQYHSMLGWLASIGSAALGFLVAYMPFLLPQYAGSSLAIVWAGKTYCSHLPGFLSTLLPECHKRPAVLAAFGMLDSCLVGAFLAVGVCAGLLIADRWLRSWHDLIARAGD